MPFINQIHANVQVVCSVFLQDQASVFPKNKVVGYIISDPALLHAALAQSAVNLSNLQSQKPSLDSYYHSGQSIGLLKSSINASNAVAGFHSTVGTIASLINVEVPARPLTFSFTIL